MCILSSAPCGLLLLLLLLLLLHSEEEKISGRLPDSPLLRMVMIGDGTVTRKYSEMADADAHKAYTILSRSSLIVEHSSNSKLRTRTTQTELSAA